MYHRIRPLVQSTLLEVVEKYFLVRPYDSGAPTSKQRSLAKSHSNGQRLGIYELISSGQISLVFKDEDFQPVQVPTYICFLDVVFYGRAVLLSKSHSTCYDGIYGRVSMRLYPERRDP